MPGDVLSARQLCHCFTVKENLNESPSAKSDVNCISRVDGSTWRPLGRPC